MTSSGNRFNQYLGCFLEGMRRHDIAKPFFLGGEQHARAGFLLLQGASQLTSALYALFHHAHQIGLPETIQFLLDWYGLTQDGEALEIPSWVFLSPWLDQLAASTYSGLTSDPQGSREIWSCQNPFSRLPRLEKLETYGKNNRASFHQNLWQEAGLDRFCSYDDFKKLLDAFHDPSKQKGMRSLIDDPTKRQVLQRYFEHHEALLPAALFPERTYPAANDTALLEHGQLTAALAFMVGGNILLQNKSWPLIARLERQQDDIYVDGQKATDFSWDSYKNTVLEHLQGRLVRIAFSEFERLFQEAIRLDDLHGVRNFLEAPGKKRLRDLFRERFQICLGRRFGPEHGVGAALRPLNDFPFDLVYLLPAALAETDIQADVRNAYNEAIGVLAKELCGEYDKDFAGVAEIPPLDPNKLQRQFAALAPFCICEEIHIEVDTSQPMEKQLTEAKRSLSEKGLEAYRRLWQPRRIKEAELERRLNEAGELGVKEACDVCTLQPVFTDFYKLYNRCLQDGDERSQIMEKVIYGHKEQQERLCQACLARRLWSHGEVQEQWLADLIEPDEQDGTVALRLKQHPALAPPPKMLPQLELKKDQPLPEDMGAAFVRWRQGRLQVYPTLAAAADADGNIALLYLTPDWQGGILGELSLWQAAVDELQCVSSIINRWTKYTHATQSDMEKWERRINSAQINEIRGAKNDIANKLSYLQDWPNTLSWHPFFYLSGLVKELAPLDPTSETGRVKNTIARLLERLALLFSFYNKGYASDLYRFEQALVAYVFGLSPQDVTAGFREEALTARPHLARVLTRIRWAHEFFQNLPKILVDEGGIRTLTLESAYPRLVVALPAADLIRALRCLHDTLASNLFSSTLYGDAPPCPTPADLADETARRCREELSFNLLQRILPPVLLGSVVIFKERQPLYHILSSARRVMEYLAQETRQYSGMLLGLTDWRQCLGAMTREQAKNVFTADFLTLYQLLDNEYLISRGPLTRLAQAADDEWGRFGEVFEALVAIKQARQGWPDRVSEALRDRRVFDAMVYLKRAAKA